MAEDEGLGTGQVVPITVADLLGYSAGTQPGASSGGSGGGDGGGGGGSDDEAARRRQEERRKKEKAAAAKKAAEEAAKKKAAAAAASQHQVQPAAARHHDQPQIRQQQKKSTTQPRGTRDATRPTARTLQSARSGGSRHALTHTRQPVGSTSLGQHGHPDPRRFDPRSQDGRSPRLKTSLGQHGHPDPRRFDPRTSRERRSPPARRAPNKAFAQARWQAPRPILSKHAVPSGHHGGGLLREVSHLVHSAVHETKHLVGLGHRAEQSAKRLAIDIAALGPYAEYYAAYQIAREINRLGAKGGRVGSVASHIIVLPLAKIQAEGLLGDVLLDLVKNESIRDEGVKGPINPLHSFKFIPSPIRGGPTVYLPGLSKKPKHGTHVDLQW